MNDKSVGYTIMTITALIMLGYFIWAFSPILGPTFQILAPYSEWAYRLPILAGVLMVLLIVIWIGYTMATTPPPIPLDNPLDLDEEKNKEEKQD
jgi:hypothetical protein